MDDIDIISKVLQGDQQSFEELVKRYQGFVFTLAFRYSHNREDAEEIAQDVFVKVYRSLAAFRKDSRFSTWLYTITVNTAMTFLRKARPHTQSLEHAGVTDAVNAQHHQAGGAHTAEQQSRRALINQVIGLLSPDDATIITLFYKAEQSIEEIGMIMGLSSNAAKVKLHRARQRLKEKLETYLAGEIREIMH